MLERVLFFTPGKTYKRMKEKDAATAYTHMAIKEFDSLMKFDAKYAPFLETPDYETVVRQKRGRDLGLTLFAQQPVIKVGPISATFTASSFLFNPKASTGNLLLPDLDIIQISGETRIQEAINRLRTFYRQRGWSSYVHSEPIDKKVGIDCEPPRNLGRIQIGDPLELLRIATELGGHNPEDLCFNDAT